MIKQILERQGIDRADVALLQDHGGNIQNGNYF